MFLRLATALLLLGAATPAAAQRGQPERPAALGRVVDCRAIVSGEERLACYDREVEAMDAAQRAGDLVAMDRQNVRRTRRSLFGLALPDLGIFGDDQTEEEAARIETTIRSARLNANGRWVLGLAEGGTWIQIDSRTLAIDPRPGQPIRIRRAAMGSYLANVNNQIAIRVRRIQ